MMYLAKEKSAKHRRLKVDVDATWVDYNPSLVRHGNEIVCSVRVSTVTCCDCGYWILPPHKRQHSDAMIGYLDDDLQFVRQRKILSRDLPRAWGDLPYGIEDLRLFTAPSGGLQAMICVRPEDFGQMGVARMEFNDDLVPTNLVRYPSPLDQLVEKNWSPFVVGRDTFVVYHWDPLLILRLNEDGSTKRIFHGGPELALDGWRGSSQGLPFGDGWLFVVHRRAFRPRRKVYRWDYTHRVIELGPDFLPRRISDEFRFLSEGIEFCGGLVQAGDRMLFSFGAHDCQSHVVSVPSGVVEKMLKPFTEKTLPLQGLPSVLTGQHADAYARRMIPPTVRSLVKEAYLTAHHRFTCVPRLRK